MWLIYSYRHRQWYRPNSRGYTKSLIEAGRYTEQQVGEIVCGALPGQLVPVDEHSASVYGVEKIEEGLTYYRRL